MTIDTNSLQKHKNLLAFSAGVDSTALFYILLGQNIKFDIAIVDYNQRQQSKTEVAHARELAKNHNLICHTTTAPKYDSHFEQNAREFRYNFFDSLIIKHEYTNLITAHQLNDQLEWLLMRLCKGAGLSELLGLSYISYRQGYQITRPLLDYSKDELLAYLNQHRYHFFVDKSNMDKKYERNRFRMDYSDRLILEFANGIKKSFGYLNIDNQILNKNFKEVKSIENLYIIKLLDLSAKSRAADITLKKLGYLLSSQQRKEIEKSNSLVIGDKWAIALQDDLLYIAPYTKTNMPKAFKELYRKSNIPSKIRPYLFEYNIDPTIIQLEGEPSCTLSSSLS